MDRFSVFYVLAGSTFGLGLRLLINYQWRLKLEYPFSKSLLVNILSSLFLGIFLAFSVNNQNLILFFYVGFLGCFSTFSSFIYQLLNLIQKRKYLSLFIYYIEVLLLSFLLFYLGYFVTLVFKS